LLDHATAKVGIDQATIGAIDRIPERAILYAFLARKAHKPLGLEDPHALFPITTNYNTMCYSFKARSLAFSAARRD
jgi:hypothetical protein